MIEQFGSKYNSESEILFVTDDFVYVKKEGVNRLNYTAQDNESVDLKVAIRETFSFHLAEQYNDFIIALVTDQGQTFIAFYKEEEFDGEVNWTLKNKMDL